MPMGYPITLWNGILDPKHVENMGSAIWEFIWLLDKITREEDGNGYVLGGAPITFIAIAADLGTTRKVVGDSLKKLSKAGYISIARRQAGFSIVVHKSKKRGWKSAPKATETVALIYPKGYIRCTQNSTSDMPKRVHQTCPKQHIRCTQKGTSLSHDMYKDKAEDSTEDMHSSSSSKDRPYGLVGGLECILEPFNEFSKEDKAALEQSALQEMAAEPTGQAWVDKTASGLVLKNNAAARMLHKIKMRAIYERSKLCG